MGLNENKACFFLDLNFLLQSFEMESFSRFASSKFMNMVL